MMMTVIRTLRGRSSSSSCRCRRGMTMTTTVRRGPSRQRRYHHPRVLTTVRKGRQMSVATTTTTTTSHAVRTSRCRFGRDMSSSTAAAATTAEHHHDDEDDGVIVPFLLADIGEGIAEVELLQWYVAPGDSVREFDAVCQVQSDKATVDITSRYEGVVTELGVAAGDVGRVGRPLLYLRQPARRQRTAEASHDDDDDGDLTARLSADAVADAVSERLRIPPAGGDVTTRYHDDDDDEKKKVLTSPAVRKLAADASLDLRHDVVGTGPQGRILKDDVVRYLRRQRRQGQEQQGQDETVPSSSSSTASPPPPSVPSPASTTTTDKDDGESEIVQLKGFSRAMVQTMTRALQIPHMTLGDEVVLDEVLALRRRIRETPSQNDKDDNDDNDISVLCFMLKACSLALRQFPLLNATVHDADRCEVRVLRHHHLGVAMDTSRGLVVPAVRHVQDKSLRDIQNDLDRLKDTVRRQDGGGAPLDADALHPTFTLSNIGALGVGRSMQAVIAPPQVAMGAVGRVTRVPRFAGDDDDDLTVRAVHVAHVSWTADHRVVDGATLARFHRVFAGYLRDPVTMLLHLK